MVEWYIPWAQIDWGLRIQLLLWLAAIALSYWIFWRSLVRKRPWLILHECNNQRRPTDGSESGPGHAGDGAAPAADAEGSETRK